MGYTLVSLVFVVSRQTHTAQRLSFGYASVKRLTEDKLPNVPWLYDAVSPNEDAETFCTRLAKEFEEVSDTPVKVVSVTVIAGGRVVKAWHSENEE